LIEQVNGMSDPISLETLYSHLLDTEARLVAQKAQYEQKEQYRMLDSAVARGGGGNDKQQNCGGFQGHRGGGCSGGRSGGNPNNPYQDHQCQVCGKLGHIALRCWKRFDKNFTRPGKLANVAASSYNLDTAWYADSVATDHIIRDLDKLAMKENYGGSDQVHVANGSGMMIKHIGQSIVSTPSRQFLHVP
jgi:hypothetical protein